MFIYFFFTLMLILLVFIRSLSIWVNRSEIELVLCVCGYVGFVNHNKVSFILIVMVLLLWLWLLRIAHEWRPGKKIKQYEKCELFFISFGVNVNEKIECKIRNVNVYIRHSIRMVPFLWRFVYQFNRNGNCIFETNIIQWYRAQCLVTKSLLAWRHRHIDINLRYADSFFFFFNLFEIQPVGHSGMDENHFLKTFFFSIFFLFLLNFI